MTAAVRVSAVMTVRNGERYIAEAIGSILEQSVAVDEIIVVDDGSDDGTCDVVSTFGDGVTVVRQPKTGIAAGLNRGLHTATGDLVAFLDADDLWEPDAISGRAAALAADPDAAAASGAVVQFLSPELPADTPRRFDPGPVHAALIGALLFRRHAFERYGRFDESVALAPVVDWVARARLAGIRIVDIDAVVLRRRIHTTNFSLVSSGSQPLGMLDVVRRQWERRRSGGVP